MEEGKIIRITNALNLTRQEFQITEKHILSLTLLALKSQQGFNAQVENEESNLELTIKGSDLKETNKTRIKDALDKITSRKIHFDHSKNDKDYFGYVVPFTYANYEGGRGKDSIITIEINRKCKKLFLELANGYTETDLHAVLSLKSSYTIRMYELLSQHKNLKRWDISIVRLKKLLDMEVTKYKNFSDFEKNILKYSQDELWEHCNIHFEWESIKTGRKITDLTFIISDRVTKEKIAFSQEIKATQDYIQGLSNQEMAYKAHLASQRYKLSAKQFDYILSSKEMFNEFIRVDLIIENMIEKGKPPRDRTKYLAKCLKLDKVKFSKERKPK